MQAEFPPRHFGQNGTSPEAWGSEEAHGVMSPHSVPHYHPNRWGCFDLDLDLDLQSTAGFAYPDLLADFHNPEQLGPVWK